MEPLAFKDFVTDAMRYWEPRRIVYNAVLAAIVLIYFGLNYQNAKANLTGDVVLFMFLLAVLANVAYCGAYIVDVFAQISGYREVWRKFRWVLFLTGVVFAGILTRFWAMSLFSIVSSR
jgi:hypothetical protein